jgi:hypothetical protein
MSKTYYKYENKQTFGVIASPYSTILYDELGQKVYTPSLDFVGIWNLRKNKLVKIKFIKKRKNH